MVYKIRCSNGKYVSATSGGNFIEYTKKGKTWNSLNLAEKNIDLCENYAFESIDPEDKILTYVIEEIGY